MPGEKARLIGSSLSKVRRLTVDGQPVALDGSSDTERTFTVPVLRTCEVDGRQVLLVANDDVTHQAPIQAPDAFHMEVGESRILMATQLTACLQLAAADQDYVLTALNLSQDRSAAPTPLLTVRAWTASGTAAAAAALRAPASMSRLAHMPSTQLGAGGDFSDKPVLFDPSYATARAGDAVRFVDWKSGVAGICHLPPAQVPSYPVYVAAVSGQTVIGIDQRSSNFADLISEQNLVHLRKAAAIADPLVFPAVREIYDRGYQPPSAAGGRHFHILSSHANSVGVSTDGGTGLQQSVCPRASEVVTTLIGNTPITGDLMARNLATTLIHEYGHNAGRITSVRARGGSTDAATDWQSEAFAVNLEETAVRIATRQPTAAKWTAITTQHPFSFHGLGALWGMSESSSPWQGGGQYDQGAAIILYTREISGEAVLGSRTSPTLYQRLLARKPTSPWSLEDLAGDVGLSAQTLLDRWALAYTTDDLIAGPAAAARDLPQLGSWNNTERATGVWGPRGGSPAQAYPSRTVSRKSGGTRTLQAGPGNVAAAYLLAEENLGISLTFLEPSPSAVLRITRLR